MFSKTQMNIIIAFLALGTVFIIAFGAPDTKTTQTGELESIVRSTSSQRKCL